MPPDAGARLRVRTALAGELAGGDSIAVNGVCLTVAAPAGGWLRGRRDEPDAGVTSLARPRGRQPGQPRAGAAGRSDRLGGHIVQGHVDGVGGGRSRSAEDGFAQAGRGDALPAGLARYVVEHGSIALDGVCLTVADRAGAGR